MKPKILGIITARGGSKGIPGKNIKPFLGKPLIAYTIEAALKAAVFDRLILSTDDPTIAEIAESYGCEVPFMRPREFAGDNSPGALAIEHALQWLKDEEGYEPNLVMVLQPTSPLRQPFHIQEAVKLILDSGADSVMSVAEMPEQFSPYKAMTVDERGFLNLFGGGPVHSRISLRQYLPKTYWSIGSIYLFKPEHIFSKAGPLYGEKVAPYYVDARYAADINVLEDWEKAEDKYQRLQNGR